MIPGVAAEIEDNQGSARAEQRVEPTPRIERRQIVAAADMLAIDEHLRHRAATASPCDHRVETGAVS